MLAQCMRGSGGLSMLPPSTECGKCLRRPTHAQCSKCWGSLPQIFDVAEQELLLKTECHVRRAD
eukprot:gene10154-15649_t